MIWLTVALLKGWRVREVAGSGFRAWVAEVFEDTVWLQRPIASALAPPASISASLSFYLCSALALSIVVCVHLSPSLFLPISFSASFSLRLWLLFSSFCFSVAVLLRGRADVGGSFNGNRSLLIDLTSTCCGSKLGGAVRKTLLLNSWIWGLKSLRHGLLNYG